LSFIVSKSKNQGVNHAQGHSPFRRRRRLSCGLGLAHAAADKPPPPAAAAGRPPPKPARSPAGVVIVTGTRATGLKVENSASPIQVLDSTSLARTGQPDLIQALAQNLPSLTPRPSAATWPT
jgi:hypothetical protein